MKLIPLTHIILDDYEETMEIRHRPPYVLSELRGNVLQRLFRFITISDGNAANEDVKFSIVNIKPDEKTFDLLVRRFNDTDANVQTVEKYSKLTMNPTDNGFIGRKIGTSDGEFPLRSEYIMVELADDYPKNGFPAGFEGVLNRTYIGTRTSSPPQIEYKTEYAPSLTTARLRKTYLGLNSGIGVDQDFFDYKGLNAVNNGVYTGRTDGFHMDENALGAEISAGDASYFPSLQVGDAPFTTNASLTGGPYEKLAARKFTYAPFGGYDGWDEYRTQRTNGDSYTKTGTNGAAGLLAGTFSTFCYH